MELAKKNFETANYQFQKAKENLNLILEGVRKKEIEAQKSRIKQIEANIKIAEENLKETELYSPITGAVLEKNL